MSTTRSRWVAHYPVWVEALDKKEGDIGYLVCESELNGVIAAASYCDDGDILVVGVTDPSGIVVANEAEPVDVYAAALQLATKMEQIAVQRYRRVILVTSSAVCADGVRGSSSRLARPLKRLATIRSAAVSTPPRAASEQACSQMFHLGFGARFITPVESSWTDASTPRRT